MQKIKVALILLLTLGIGNVALAAGPVQSTLRSAASILPIPLPPGLFAPTAPAGGLVIGSSTWTCDAAEGFAPVVPVDPSSVEPLLAVSSSGIHLPTASGFGNATGGELAYDGNGYVYVTQGVVAGNTPSNVQGILRVAVDPITGLPLGAPVVIAANSGLGGNQPTAIALGPDGDLYFGNLKNGDIKRIINPSVGTTQVVQSVGKTPNGRTVRSMAFVGNNLYIGASDTLSVIAGATNQTLCQGGCNATPIGDGFSGTAHVGIAAAGSDGLYFAVGGGVNQVWHYTQSSGAFALVSSGGVDRNGANAASFTFVDSKSNMLDVDLSGNLWIGDDTSGGTIAGAGRIWTISAAQLATVGGGTVPPNPAVVAAVRDNWFVEIGTDFLFTTFNADGTYTATIQHSDGSLAASSGIYTITQPLNPLAILNPQAHLTLTDSTGTVLIQGDIFLLRVDQFAMTGTDSFNPFLPQFFQVIWLKQTV